MPRGDVFTRFASAAARGTGHPAAFLGAILVIAVWLAAGPVFGFSDTWQLVVNTATTIVTFLMVFLIQNTQNRDAHAMQIKLDELIRVAAGADEALLDLEELSDGDLTRIRRWYERRAEAARRGRDPDKIPLER
jgi:low affinity Fe/Cu permease